MSILDHISWNRPFTFRLRCPFRISFEKGQFNPHKKKWAVTLQIGPGAGYILGSTIYLAHYCHGTGERMYEWIPWQLGWTRNANNVPGVPY